MAKGIYKKKKSIPRRFYNQVRRGLGFALTPLGKKILGKRPHAEIENEKQMARTRKYNRRTPRVIKRRRVSGGRKGKSTLSAKVFKIQKQLTGPTKYLFWATGITGSQSNFDFNILSQSYQKLLTVAPRASTSATVQSRVGDKTYVTGIHFEGEIRAGPLIDEDCFVYIFLVYQKKVDGTSTDFCADYFGTVTPKAYQQSNFNNDNKKSNWRILASKKIALKQLVVDQMDRRRYTIGWKKKATSKGLVVSQTLDATGTISSISSGAIYYVTYSPDLATGLAAGGDYLQSNSQGRLYFKDSNINSV